MITYLSLSEVVSCLSLFMAGESCAGDSLNKLVWLALTGEGGREVEEWSESNSLLVETLLVSCSVTSCGGKEGGREERGGGGSVTPWYTH